MIKIIAAVSQNGVIGIDNKIPWNYPEDMKHFRKMTLNNIVIMGRKTFESMGSRILPKRKNIIVSSKCIEFEESQISQPTLHGAIYHDAYYNNTENKDIWLIGGSSIYQEGMKYADEIHLTLVPDIINQVDSIKFPWINPLLFKLDKLEKLPSENTDTKLMYAVLVRNN